jgi:hypothetical protein
MANGHIPLAKGCLKVTLDTTGGYEGLSDPTGKLVGRWVLHVVNGGANPGSFIPKLRAKGSSLASGEWRSPEYYNKATGSTAITAATPVTAEAIYEVLCDGCELILDYTADTHGMTVYAVPVTG